MFVWATTIHVQLVSVRAADLESCLLMLPFMDALRLLDHLPTWLSKGVGQQHIELITRVAVLLLRLHHTQLLSTAAARPTLIRLSGPLRNAVQVSYSCVVPSLCLYNVPLCPFNMGLWKNQQGHS